MVNVNGYYSGAIDVEIDFDDMWSSLTLEEQEKHAREIMGAWPELIPTVDLEWDEIVADDEKREAIFTALSGIGYTVLARL